ncbi:hypothetical protein NE237_014046 [Protea cynaroides]|uniref:Cytochrome c assembly protein domain-containing protein n=1 Tax=Protea cynaroides TaxID=273540 RepID=A0A9Q0H2U9_9MAGN|nr:hypothetical protein NE237_014046 [Protea cynaroides]
MFLSWSFSIIHIVSKIWNHKNHLSVITAPSAIFIQGFATSGLLTELQQSAILVPALKSQWLMMHISMMVLSYAALLCGSLLSLALLVITFRKNIEIFGKINHLLIGNFHRYQLIHQLDYWSYRVISLGFIFLTIGTLAKTFYRTSPSSTSSFDYSILAMAPPEMAATYNKEPTIETLTCSDQLVRTQTSIFYQ